MKILLTSDTYIPAVNGVVTSLLTLRRELTRRGHQVRVLTLSGDSRGWQADGVYAMGSLDAGRIYPGARLRTPALSTPLAQLIAWCPDVVHSQCEFSTFGLAKRIAKACGAPLIHTYHTVYEDYTHYFSPSRRWGRWMVKTFTRYITARTDGVIAPSGKVRELLEGYGVRAPIRVIPTGIDLDRFAVRPAPDQLARRRAELGIPEGRTVLLYMGRLAREKSIDLLLECRADLGDAPVTLLLAGGGPDETRLRERAAALGLQAPAVVFAGMVPPREVPLFYHLGDVFVSASASETQGLTYFEAMAAGLPLVCRADPCLDGVLTDGSNGWQYTSAAGRDSALRALLANPALRRAMGRCSEQTAEQFSAARFARQVEALYREARLARLAASQPWPGRGLVPAGR